MSRRRHVPMQNFDRLPEALWIHIIDRMAPRDVQALAVTNRSNARMKAYLLKNLPSSSVQMGERVGLLELKQKLLPRIVRMRAWLDSPQFPEGNRLWLLDALRFDDIRRPAMDRVDGERQKNNWRSEFQSVTTGVRRLFASVLSWYFEPTEGGLLDHIDQLSYDVLMQRLRKTRPPPIRGRAHTPLELEQWLTLATMVHLMKVAPNTPAELHGGNLIEVPFGNNKARALRDALLASVKGGVAAQQSEDVWEQYAQLLPTSSGDYNMFQAQVAINNATGDGDRKRAEERFAAARSEWIHDRD